MPTLPTPAPTTLPPQAAAPQKGEQFVDLGSGAGRLCLASALLYPSVWGEVIGIELLAGLHDLAIDARMKLETLPASDEIRIAPMDYSCQDIYSDESAATVRSGGVFSSFSVTWGREGDVLTELSAFLDAHAPAGARIITIDLKLAGGFELQREVEGEQDEIGECIGYVYKKL